MRQPIVLPVRFRNWRPSQPQNSGMEMTSAPGRILIAETFVAQEVEGVVTLSFAGQQVSPMVS